MLLVEPVPTTTTTTKEKEKQVEQEVKQIPLFSYLIDYMLACLFNSQKSLTFADFDSLKDIGFKKKLLNQYFELKRN